MKQGDFTEMAKHYHNRPAYSPFLLKKLLACVNDSAIDKENFSVVDVGAGTGKLTTVLVNDLGLKLTAVEPNAAMREEGIKTTQNLPIQWLDGSGENIPLPDGVANWVLMASSFHWTNPQQSLPEIARVLKNEGGGYLTVLYNPRDLKEGSVFAEIEREIKTIVPELKRVSSGLQNTKKWEEVLVSTGDFADCFFMECAYEETWSKARYLGAWHSVNDIQAQAGEKRWAQILKMIENKIAPLDELKIPYKMRAWTVRKIR